MKRRRAMTCAEAGHLGGLAGGRKGGLAVKRRLGVEFYRRIGRLGAKRLIALIAAGRRAKRRSR